MKTRTIYICEMCGTEHRSCNEAYKCEAKCLGLTYEQYQKYMNLLKEERNAFSFVSITANDETRKRCDDAVKAVIDFKNRYNIIDTR